MQAAVVGGGLLGLEAAKALYDLDTAGPVTIVHRQTFPLSRQLDAAGGEIVLRRIEALGVRVRGDVAPVRVLTSATVGSDEQVLTGLELADGSVVSCRIAVFAVGVRPRDELARAAGIRCAGDPDGATHTGDKARDGRARGIAVDDLLRTTARDVYALGECASWRGQTYGLIAPGVEMADLLAFNLTQTDTALGAFAPRRMVRPFSLL